MQLIDFSKLIVDKSNPKPSLLAMLSQIKLLEERALNTYDKILSSRELPSSTKSIISSIRSDEAVHVKIAVELIRIVTDYDFKLELMEA